ncbi:tRNA-guanine transglycosylase DpdA [Luteolibacter flavescens]|uniref:tRNA-guanine transglycosylase DpdA n=1 Tax=Luteolibacter flavescens TaxID=1859460 RepID=A0ABT3FT24_9BACT|nr:tRNA-guanine transglycosylase DpdA [Luteolibacter flavescens]MCW1886728.1 tRNA-guanine transglycosylase DpdA [Luteolibacter flavescens]
MKSKELRGWADALSVPADFRRTVAGKYDLGLILLGDNYLQACALDDSVDFRGPTVLFCGTGMAKKLPAVKRVRVVPISNPEAKRFSCGLVGLKGELAARLLRGITADPEVLKRILDPKFDLLDWLEKQPGAGKDSEKGSSKPAKAKTPVSKDAGSQEKKPPMRANPAVDKVIQIPTSWWDKPHRQRLRYFIPEWDDLVDPDYDFLSDTHSGPNCGWEHATYAHQMFPEPNYDGLLMSRAVAEKSKAKKERINAMGVHRMLRVPRNFPVMGDCGAFDYIMEEVPPYTTDDVLDYYTRLDFDFGVSVDHLIVSATEKQKRFRYDLTIENAADFFREHKKAGLKWQPIGAVQGWDPVSYAKAAEKYVKMGYRYLGLGGLVRSTTTDILNIVLKVRERIPKDVSIHLFGIARLDWMDTFAKAGVQSVDSASYLRQAWMRLHQSYASMDGPYAALRIPEAGKSFRAKHMRDHPELSDDKILAMEQRALKAVREYGQHKLPLRDALGALLDYDQFVTKERVSMEPAYRRTLEDRPWERCECDICRRDGIEVAIFRGNNRNRRRGFHNTWVFYRALQKVLAGENVPFLKDVSNTSQMEMTLT